MFNRREFLKNTAAGLLAASVFRFVLPTKAAVAQPPVNLPPGTIPIKLIIKTAHTNANRYVPMFSMMYFVGKQIPMGWENWETFDVRRLECLKS